MVRKDGGESTWPRGTDPGSLCIQGHVSGRPRQSVVFSENLTFVVSVSTLCIYIQFIDDHQDDIDCSKDLTH